MSYRPALHRPQGSWGRFLDQTRRERDWSAVQAWENLHGFFGPTGLSVKSTAVYKSIEQGLRAVSPEEDEALRAYFGKGPDNGESEVQPPVDPLVAAIADQSKAIRENTAAVQQLLALLVPLAARGIGLGSAEVAAIVRASEVRPDESQKPQS